MSKIKLWISSIESPTQKGRAGSPCRAHVLAQPLHALVLDLPGVKGRFSFLTPHILHSSDGNALTKWNRNKSIISMPHSATQWTRSQVTHSATTESINPLAGIKHGQLCIYCRKSWNSKRENWLQLPFPHDWKYLKLMQQDTELSNAGTNRISIYLRFRESNLTAICYWNSQ